MERKSFLDQEAPAGYVAGLGRGAVGFTTQADLGSTRFSAGAFQRDNDDDDDDGANGDNSDVEGSGLNYEDGRFDDADDIQSGNLLNRDQEDDEADKIYDLIEERMRQRKLKRDGNKRKYDDIAAEDDDKEKEDGKVKAENITVQESIKNISENFKDLKENLKNVDEDQWMNLPKATDLTRKNKRTKQLLQNEQRYYAVPDSVRLGGGSTLAANGTGVTGNSNSTDNSNSNLLNFEMISSAKDKLLEMRLDNGKFGLNTNITNNNSVNPEEYLANLDNSENINESGNINQEMSETSNGDDTSNNNNIEKFTDNIGDVRKTRIALANMRKTEPSKPSVWISSARLEESVKNYQKARILIQEGCNHCRKSEEIWLENIRLNINDIKLSKAIVSEAIKFNNRSYRLWLKAIELENENFSKKRLLKKSLEFLPKNLKLWLKLCEIEEDKEFKIKVLNKAIELLPDHSIELVNELIKVETFENSKKILNDIRNKVKPTERYLVYLIGSKLEEKNTQNEIKIDKMIKKVISNDLKKSDDKYLWLRESVISENEGYKITCRSIILNLIANLDIIDSEGDNKIEEEDAWVNQWVIDAENAFNNGNFEVARSIYIGITEKFPNKFKLWKIFIDFEKNLVINKDVNDNNNNNKYEQLFLVYDLAISCIPQEEVIWLMYSKDKWKLENDIERSKLILDQGLKEFDYQSEDIWFAKIKLELIGEGNNTYTTTIDKFNICNSIIEEAKIKLNEYSERLIVKQVNILRYLKKYQECIELIEIEMNSNGNKSYYKYYLQLISIYEDDLKDYVKVKEIFSKSIKIFPKNEIFWILYSKFEEFKNKFIIRSRSILDQGLNINFNNDKLWEERILLEIRNNNFNQGIKLLEKSLKIIPNSARLLRIRVNYLGKTLSQKKNLFVQCLNLSNDNPIVILSIANNLIKFGKFTRAKNFYQKCIEIDKDYGDCYIYYYKYLTCGSGSQGNDSEENRKEIEEFEKQFNRNEPHHGDEWCHYLKKIDNLDKPPLEILKEASENVTI
ncbi:hypothetical protein BVG19_g4247 [[Candida] boidinii]|nr:hypothetical protein BVG19_g4247 [[Candida] boidinii]OWB51098.1 hypothetical protein B5S27_g2656 [[Candida] boidinii]